MLNYTYSPQPTYSTPTPYPPKNHYAIRFLMNRYRQVALNIYTVKYTFISFKLAILHWSPRRKETQEVRDV